MNPLAKPNAINDSNKNMEISMDPVTGTGAVMLMHIVEGVVSRAIFELLATPFRNGETEKRLSEIKRLLNKNEKVSDLVQKSAVAFAKQAIPLDGPDAEKIRLHLASPEVAGTMLQIIGWQHKPSRENQSNSYKQFRLGLSVALKRSPEDIDRISKQVFDLLCTALDETMSTAIENGVLAAHEIRSIQRHRAVQDELGAIGKKLEFLVKSNEVDIQGALEFEKKYRKQVSERHQFITPPTFDGQKKIAIDALYVSPCIRPIHNKPQKSTKRIPNGSTELSYLEFIPNVRRTVLLGNPGGGKSTISLKLCHDLASKNIEDISTGWHRTPALVVLRDYGAEKKQRNCSILDFIETRANSHYQQSPPKGAFEYLLLTGRLLVIFDGLDELLESHYRQEISQDVESFSVAYPSIPILVTSRYVGYHEAPLNPKAFECYGLQNFNHDQVTEYVTKWFYLDEDLSPAEKQRKSTDFIKESEIVPDLRANPLMLALICNIYRGDGYIPTNRPDVYEKCAVMLFERWDKTRGINAKLPFEALVRRTMTFLAHWIYQDEALQSGVVERELINQAKQYLRTSLYENDADAEVAATQFIEFCRGRAWVFTDVGTTKDGDRLYQFTHRTFLEYFAALYLVRQHSSADQLWNILHPRIARGEWDVIAQLAYQLLDKNIEGAGDALIEKTIRTGISKKGKERLYLIRFAARCLHFLVPKPSVTREVASGTLEFYLSSINSISDRESLTAKSRHGFADELMPTLGHLLVCNVESRPIVAQVIEATLLDRIRGDGSFESAMAFLATESFFMAIYLSTDGQAPAETQDFWISMISKISTLRTKQLRVLAERYIVVARAVVNSYNENEAFDLNDFFSKYGTQGFFQDTERPTFYGGWASLAASRIQRFAFMAHDGAFDKVMEQQLTCISKNLIDNAPPWTIGQSTNDHDIDYMLRRVRPEKDKPSTEMPFDDLSVDCKFGAICLIAVVLEQHSRLRTSETLLNTNVPPIQKIGAITIGRFHKERLADSLLELGKIFPHRDKRRSLLESWLKHEISFVRHADVHQKQIEPSTPQS